MAVIALDTESTGLEKPIRIIQLGFFTIKDGKELCSSTLIKPTIKSGELSRYGNRFRTLEGEYIATIDPDAQEITGIDNTALNEAKDLGKIAPKLIKFFNGEFILVMNGYRFDIPLIMEELERFDHKGELDVAGFIDLRRLDKHFNPINHPRTVAELLALYKPAKNYGNTRDALLSAMMQKFNLSLFDVAPVLAHNNGYEKALIDLHYLHNGNKLVDLHRRYIGGEFKAHDAGEDAKVAYEVYQAMKGKYGFTDEEAAEISFPKDPVDLADFTRHVSLDIVGADYVALVNIGKQKGRTVRDFMMDDSYDTKGFIDWLLPKDFDWIFKEYLKKYHISLAPKGQDLDTVFPERVYPEFIGFYKEGDTMKYVAMHTGRGCYHCDFLEEDYFTFFDSAGNHISTEITVLKEE